MLNGNGNESMAKKSIGLNSQKKKKKHFCETTAM